MLIDLKNILQPMAFTLFLGLLALPAHAQQENVCRGKQPFDLGDGAKGCLLDLGSTSITTTRTRTDGGTTKPSSKSAAAGMISVALFGAYDPSKKIQSPRIKKVCRTFLPNLKAASKGASYNRVVVQLIWPAVVSSTSAPIVQSAFSNGYCRGVRFFGR